MKEEMKELVTHAMRMGYQEALTELLVWLDVEKDLSHEDLLYKIVGMQRGIENLEYDKVKENIMKRTVNS